MKQHTIDFSKDRLIDMHYAVMKVWEKEYTDLMKEVFSLQDVNTFLDLGANTGIVIDFCNRFFSDNVKIIAFEPVSENFEMLKEKIKTIKKLKNARLYQKAVFYGTDKAYAYGVGDNSSAGLFLEGTLPDVDPNDHRKPILTTHIFECTTLENEISDINLVDVCKIDVEGSEYNIIRNSSFLRERVNNILLEYHWKTEKQAIDWLKENLPSHEIVKSVYETIWLKKK